MARGGTVNCVSELIKSNHKEIVGLLVVVELVDLRGRFKLDFPVNILSAFDISKIQLLEKYVFNYE